MCMNVCVCVGKCMARRTALAVKCRSCVGGLAYYYVDPW